MRFFFFFVFCFGCRMRIIVIYVNLHCTELMPTRWFVRACIGLWGPLSRYECPFTSFVYFEKMFCELGQVYTHNLYAALMNVVPVKIAQRINCSSPDYVYFIYHHPLFRQVYIHTHLPSGLYTRHKYLASVLVSGQFFLQFYYVIPIQFRNWTIILSYLIL